MKKYFIDITWYVAKNNLEERLQNSFNELEHKVIPEDKLMTEIDLRFNKVLSEYQRNKGKAQPFFNRNGIDSNSLQYKIGQSTILHLTLIKGEL